MELLISIKGVTPLIALAFLADVADVRRFRTVRKMNAYLGLVPRAKNSGGKERAGHITRESRKLTRMILTQCVHHVAASSVSLDRCYRELREKRGTGRARVAMIRKLCGMMRMMLLNGEQYRCMDRGAVPEEAQAVRENAEENEGGAHGGLTVIIVQLL